MTLQDRLEIKCNMIKIYKSIDEIIKMELEDYLEKSMVKNMKVLHKDLKQYLNR